MTSNNQVTSNTICRDQAEQMMRMLNAIDPAIEAVSAILHQKWLEEYISSNGGKCPPRIKKVQKEYASMPGVFLGEDGNYCIDIAVSFDKLTPDWQEANKNMAKYVVEMLCETNFGLDNETYCHNIHEYWLKQNSWPREGPLGIPYKELPKEEQAKDQVVFDICYKELRKRMML